MKEQEKTCQNCKFVAASAGNTKWCTKKNRRTQSGNYCDKHEMRRSHG